MAKVARLGYLGLEVSDALAWVDFGVDMLGLAPADASPGGARRLRMDDQAWRIALHEGDADDLLYAGFEVDAAADLEQLAGSLGADDLDVEEADAVACNERGVRSLIRVRDPAGNPIEIFYGATSGASAFESKRVPGGFVTGDEGLGHIVLNAPDAAAMQHFYCDLLGLRLSDRIEAEVAPGFKVEIQFLHANARHHSVAFAEVVQPKRLDHVMLEMNALTDVGLARDRCQAGGVRILNDLGQHPNDLMFSFYAKTPSGCRVEVGHGGRKVDDATWEPTVYFETSLWGHRRPPKAAKAGA